ncbi:hypothetical protein [Streptomyces yaizuensis]|uniref:Secreted protein n=1 Tax=Streptomyces yaizuensis TaxID=2989713 RepID=A0ABQ5NT49_9ACTN|nr:hypothetical protein [Streptomyces sp. YSPA8]GLF93535.1 hypothetical protein SYYSPA8_04580 [Streptomyces sp. YSPA8]
MRKSLAVFAATAATAAALTLGTASTATAAPGFWQHSHHVGQAACTAKAAELRPLYGALHLCKPSPFWPDVYELWFRY